MLIAALLPPATALAELRIDDARFHEGALVVHGTTSAPLQTVTLDRRFTATSDHDGRFSFQLRHTPFLCVVKLSAGTESQEATVTDCIMDDRRLQAPQRERIIPSPQPRH
jgi:hypothetical protein